MTAEMAPSFEPCLPWKKILDVNQFCADGYNFFPRGQVAPGSCPLEKYEHSPLARRAPASLHRLGAGVPFEGAIEFAADEIGAGNEASSVGTVPKLANGLPAPR